MNLCGYVRESINEGKGLRAVLFISGCRHACPGCFNQEAWDFEAGEPFTAELKSRIIEEIADNPLLEGVTLCGGDPFFSAEECICFLSELKERCPEKNIWAYTGYTFEALMRQPKLERLALMCDVIVDGKFLEQEKDVSLPFRGSRNQRLVDVPNSVKQGYVVEITLP
ncbi:anaerobic ribonucleoside-triphosphate reductase activating protein [Paenibacillus dakarensis]|uniref:anaerobic ribonucleoside-triphosphate reductase activating protein n=1 Tax=Paenibacillus dakarensis TaxID=1527293 RepID=UPI0006D579B7|nr:anaerobic ribonucleoside-triphosphate reductase activating protein [Paenibacillus dakarensis]